MGALETLTETLETMSMLRTGTTELSPSTLVVVPPAPPTLLDPTPMPSRQPPLIPPSTTELESTTLSGGIPLPMLARSSAWPTLLLTLPPTTSTPPMELFSRSTLTRLLALLLTTMSSMPTETKPVSLDTSPFTPTSSTPTSTHHARLGVLSSLPASRREIRSSSLTDAGERELVEPTLEEPLLPPAAVPMPLPSRPPVCSTPSTRFTRSLGPPPPLSTPTPPPRTGMSSRLTTTSTSTDQRLLILSD